MIEDVYSRLERTLKAKGLSFITCGVINTLFGYWGSVFFYYLLEHILDVAVIIVLTRIMTITFSFLTYKLFVFKTKGNWWSEYFRCYLAYGVTTMIVMILLYILVKVIGWPFYLAQLVAMCIGVLSNFITHSCFTFYQHGEPE